MSTQLAQKSKKERLLQNGKVKMYVENMHRVQFTQDAEADLHANLQANPLILPACCVNIPMGNNWFHSLLATFVSTSASCVKGAQGI